ncbi:hypothetical protein V1281_000323 [Nitrobacteraceae bacterium AZCC 2161]
MHFGPLALSTALLVFWSTVGRAFLVLTKQDLSKTQATLLSPVAGLALHLVLAFWLSAIGLGASSFSLPLALALLAFSLFGNALKLPSVHRSEIILIIPILLATIVIALPSVIYGFDWVANANDDWANYNLSAQRLVSSGLYHIPSLDRLKSGDNYPGMLWFLLAALDGRPGADLIIAWTSAITGRNPFFIFMAVSLAFYACLCMAAASLAAKAIQGRARLLTATLLTAFAPLSFYSVNQQLIAQTLGLCLMCATAGVTFVNLNLLAGGRRILLAILFAAAYFLAYPETVPFFGVAFIIFHLRHWRLTNLSISTAFKVTAIPVLGLLALGPYSIGFFYYLHLQFQKSGGMGFYDSASIFPFFRVPSGLSTLFGLTTLGQSLPEPILSFSVAFAIFLLALAIAGALLDLRRGGIIGPFIVSILLATGFLIVRGNDFGLFKIAMICQTFIWFAVVIALDKVHRAGQIVTIVILIGTVALTDTWITQDAVSATVGTATTVPNASRDRLLTLSQLTSNAPCNADFTSSSPPVLKIFSSAEGCRRSFSARALIFPPFLSDANKAVSNNPLHRVTDTIGFTSRAYASLTPSLTKINFPNLPAGIEVETYVSPLAYTPVQQPWSEPTIISEDSSAARAIFLSSSLGSHFYIPDFQRISMFQIENDPFFPTKMAAIGRYLLFKLDRPASSVRLQISLSSTFLADGRAILPTAKIIGGTTASIDLVGRGSARAISEPFSPYIQNGTAYFLLDLGTDGDHIKTPRTGLMMLYGQDVSLDYRRLTTFARDIRIIPTEVRSTTVEAIQSFPDDLGAPDFRYSGIYEDGWVGETGYFVVHAKEAGYASMYGMVPDGIGVESSQLTLKSAVGATTIPTRRGAFLASVPVAAGENKILFSFSAVGRLPGKDGRPVSALIYRANFEPDFENLPKAVAPGMRLLVKSASGLYWDSWTAPNGEMIVEAEKASTLTITGQISGFEEQSLTMGLNIQEMKTYVLGDGPFSINFPLNKGRNRLQFVFAREQQLPDGRRVSGMFERATIQ